MYTNFRSSSKEELSNGPQNTRISMIYSQSKVRISPDTPFHVPMHDHPPACNRDHHVSS